jgi:hypothetical protein
MLAPPVKPSTMMWSYATTVPSAALNAANVDFALIKCTTLRSCSSWLVTAQESPPVQRSPAVVTVPSDRASKLRVFLVTELRALYCSTYFANRHQIFGSVAWCPRGSLGQQLLVK